VSLVGVVIIKFAYAIARVLKRVEIWVGGGVTFGVGVTAPFVASSSTVGKGGPNSLCPGSRNRRVVAASRIPQGIRSLHHGRSCHVVASSYCLMHGWWQTHKKHAQKKIFVRRNTRGEMLF
jgi:hypothetical protein